MGFPLLTQTDCDVISPMEDYPSINHDIEHVEKSFYVVTYSTICTGCIQHNCHDVNIVKVTMTKQNFQNNIKITASVNPILGTLSLVLSFS